MSKKGIIFDLDQTILNTSSLEGLRRKRKWSNVYEGISNLSVYEGINEAYEWLIENGIPIAVVTNSPSSYCTRVLAHIGWDVDYTVCYHDVTNRKPNAEPMLKAIEGINSDASLTLSIGDKADDITSTHRAGAIGVAALWGTDERAKLLATTPEYKPEAPIDLISIFEEFYG